MPAIGFESSADALDALGEVYEKLAAKCLEEQREAASSSERKSITAQYENLLTTVAKALDYLRRIPEPPKPEPYTPRDVLEDAAHDVSTPTQEQE